MVASTSEANPQSNLGFGTDKHWFTAVGGYKAAYDPVTGSIIAGCARTMPPRYSWCRQPRHGGLYRW